MAARLPVCSLSREAGVFLRSLRAARDGPRRPPGAAWFYRWLARTAGGTGNAESKLRVLNLLLLWHNVHLRGSFRIC